MTFGRSLKCLLILDDGTVIGCGITTKTIVARMGNTHPEDGSDKEYDTATEEE